MNLGIAMVLPLVSPATGGSLYGIYFIIAVPSYFMEKCNEDEEDEEGRPDKNPPVNRKSSQAVAEDAEDLREGTPAGSRTKRGLFRRHTA